MVLKRQKENPRSGEGLSCAPQVGSTKPALTRSYGTVHGVNKVNAAGERKDLVGERHSTVLESRSLLVVYER